MSYNLPPNNESYKDFPQAIISLINRKKIKVQVCSKCGKAIYTNYYIQKYYTADEKGSSCDNNDTKVICEKCYK